MSSPGLMLRLPRTLASFVAIAVLALSTFASVGAQEPATSAGAQEPAAAPSAATPLLPPGHWAVEAARRAEALGLVERYLPAQRAVSRMQVGAALREAAERAVEHAPAWAGLTDAWYLRFREEFPEIADLLTGEEHWARLGGSGVFVGYTDQVGRVGPGIGHFPPERTGVLPVPDQSGMIAAASLATLLGRHLAILVEPQVGPDRIGFAGLDVVTLWGPLSLSLGRQPVGYGYSRSGGVVLGGEVPLDRVQIETAHPFELPGTLRALGLVSLHTFLSRFTEERHIGDPFFWGAGGSLRPHPRFTISVQRAAFIGGGHAPEPLTPYNLLLTFFGKHVGHLANQIVAAEFRYRLPTERFLPLTAYTEWGAEDSSGAFFRTPGRIFGLFVPALPALPQLAAGIERSSFAASCCGNPPWFRHAAHAGNWVQADQTLAHPLGGQGSEWLLYGEAALLDARLNLDARLFSRHRDGENLFVPGREGRSTGFAAQAIWRAVPSMELRFFLSREAGEGWVERALQTGVRMLF